ncbi:MAG: 16S rRNA (adenine(1518)-N(6)/adenine(1519)-N(6))-dimethyltransferase RsmA [Anaerolineales bacterium]
MKLPELDVPRLLYQSGLHPDKSLGQNFLQDETALQQVVEAANITSLDIVLEIGPGLGSLTRHLALNAHKVVAIELDSNLIPILRKVVDQYANVQVIQGDFLALDPAALISQPDYLVVANIPYNITSALIRHLLEASLPPRRLVLTVQQEVAQRICATPGDMSLLALSVQVYGHPKIIAHIPATAFYPLPRVDSSIIRIDRYPSPLIPVEELEAFFRLIKAGFSQKRKTLRNALAGGLQISSSAAEILLNTARVDPMRRAETLSLSEWHMLTSVFGTQLPSA